MPGDGDFCEWRESSGLWILSLSVTSPSLYFNPCRSGRSQQGWGSGDSGDTSPLSVGRASEVSCKLRASRYGSAKGEDLGNGKWTGAEIWCRKKCKSYWERKACRWPFLERKGLVAVRLGAALTQGHLPVQQMLSGQAARGRTRCAQLSGTHSHFLFLEIQDFSTMLCCARAQDLNMALPCSLHRALYSWWKLSGEFRPPFTASS